MSLDYLWVEISYRVYLEKEKKKKSKYNIFNLK